MSFREIAEQVERLHREVESARAAGTAFWQTAIEQEIRPSLGLAVVDAGGNLQEVRLDRAGLRVADPRTIGDKVMAAIHEAEARAAAAREEFVNHWAPR